MPKSNTKAFSFKRTLNLNSSSNQINGNIFIKRKTITLIDVIYDKNLPITVTASQDLSEFSSSKSLEKPFKRTISRLYELTSMKYDL